MTPIEIVIANSDSSGGINACWDWQKGVNHYGYGVFTLRQEPYYAHRVALELVVGRLGRKCALHRCDNRRCTNPNHLFVGTRADNMKDMMWKERHGRHSKLSREQIMEILRDNYPKRNPHAISAKKYGVSESLICMILKGHWHAECFYDFFRTRESE